MIPIQTVNYVLKWSFALSGMAVLAVLGMMFALWLLIEMLAVLAGVTV